MAISTSVSLKLRCPIPADPIHFGALKKASLFVAILCLNPNLDGIPALAG
jgi:hypothetical protein